MSIIDCDKPFSINGEGKASYSFGNTPAIAIALATQQAQSIANTLAGAEALNYACSVECPQKVVSSASIRITNSRSSWMRLIDLLASLFWWEWKYSGHVEFTWQATITCTPPPEFGQTP